MTSRFNVLCHGAADEVAAILSGDNPPDTLQDLRAALTNALTRLHRLEAPPPPVVPREHRLAHEPGAAISALSEAMRYLPQMDEPTDRFDRLPRCCAIRVPGSEAPALLRRGHEGYFPLHHATDVERFNRERGITPVQIEAMKGGSMFGWHTPGADPLYVANPDAFMADVMARGDRE